MGISCGCDYDWEPEPGDTVYRVGDFSILDTKTRKRCCSCGEMIEIGDCVLKIHRWKVPEYEIEFNIYGEGGEVPRAPKYHCEECGGIYLSLEAVEGLCVSALCDQRSNLKDYHEMRKWDK